jgi:hypothetical protein
VAKDRRDAARAAGAAGGPLARLRAALPGRNGGTRTAPTDPPPPRVRFTRDDARRLNERFGMLGRAERRAIVRAVNRGEAMPRRRDAEIAVGVARRQQRFWSRAWLLGPAIAVVQVLATPIGWLEGLLLAAWGALLLGMMAAWWWTRARRAEHENLLVLGGRAGRATSGGPAEADLSDRRRGRLPGAASREDDGTDEARPGPTEARPPRPRGRKRR